MASLNETVMSLRPGRVPMQQSPGASKIGGPGRKTKGSQRPSRDDRMLKGVDNLIRNIYVETPEAQKEAPKAVTINKYEPIASYSWKDIEHPTIYVPDLLLIQHNWASDEPLSTRHSIPLSTAPDVIRPDRQVIAIKSLLLELKTAINATTPLSYPYIYLSYPDTVAKRSTHCGRFDTVAEEGGFGIMRAGGSSRLALYEHGTRSCCDGEDEDQSCVDEQCDPGVKVVLAVSLMEENLETVVLTRTHGLWAMWGSPRTAIDVHLGLGSSEYARKEPYWREVKEAIAKNVRTDRIDRVMLLSEHWESQDLRKAVQEALGGTARDRTPDARLFEEPIFAYEQRCVVCCSWKRDGCERGVVGSS